MEHEHDWKIFSYIVDKDSKVLSPLEENQLSRKYKYSWEHLDANYSETRNWLEEERGLDPIWIDALLAEDTRPRIVKISNEALLINIRGINTMDKDEPEDMVSLRMYITKNSIISCRFRKSKAVSTLKNDFVKEDPPENVYEFVVRLCKYISDEMALTISHLSEEIDDLEEFVLKESDKDIRQRIIDVRRQMIILKRYLAPNNAVLQELLNLKSFVKHDIEDHHDLAEIYNKMLRFVEEVLSAKERLQVVHEEMNNHLTDRLNKNTLKLSVVATIFLPLSFLTGLFGVNLGGIPGAVGDYAFTIFCFAIFCVFLLQLFLFKWIYKI